MPFEVAKDRVLVSNYTECNTRGEIYLLFVGEKPPTLPAGATIIGPIESVNSPIPTIEINIARLIAAINKTG
jgi:hypothetical protein